MALQYLDTSWDQLKRNDDLENCLEYSGLCRRVGWAPPQISHKRKGNLRQVLIDGRERLGVA